MSMWKSLFAFAGGAVTGPVAGKVMDAAITLLNNPQTGGLAGLVQTFRDKGLGRCRLVLDRHRGEPRGLRARGAQALGEDRIQQVAQSASLTNHEASQGLAALLPQIIDMLTPDGKLPEGAAAQSGGAQTDGIAQALAAIRNKLMA